MATIAVEHRPKGPGAVYGVASILSLLLVAALALTARQPPPPAIAELAPQAVEQIKDAPAEQSSDFGSADGGSGTAGADTTTTTVPTTAVTAKAQVDVARVRRCVGDPPRQTEDPQSPPCVPFWEGDNGGATSKGVTADEIRIAVPNYDDNAALYGELETFFNRRFEFYGRKLRLISNQKDISADPAVQQAIAARADEELDAFASTSYFNDGGYHYMLELARRKIVGAFFQPMMTEALLDENHPYLWQYAPAVDSIGASEGDWICKRLARRTAEHAGDPLLRERERQIGVILQSFHDDNPISVEPLRAALARCDVAIAATFEADNFGDVNTGANNAILRMRQEDVTTVVCLCLQLATKTLGQTASQQGYFPEWIVSSYYLLDNNWTMRNFSFPPEQRTQAFGISFFPRQLPVSSYPWRWAATEVNPQTESGQTGGANSSAFMYSYFRYADLLLLASGIQTAGPTLTPETFARGLQRTIFPNPDHPNRAGEVGFARDAGAHSMINDGVEWWWGETQPSPYPEEATGTICYLDDGRRYGLRDWPSGRAPLFEAPCDSGA